MYKTPDDLGVNGACNLLQIICCSDPGWQQRNHRLWSSLWWTDVSLSSTQQHDWKQKTRTRTRRDGTSTGPEGFGILDNSSKSTDFSQVGELQKTETELLEWRVYIYEYKYSSSSCKRVWFGQAEDLETTKPIKSMILSDNKTRELKVFVATIEH